MNKNKKKRNIKNKRGRPLIESQTTNIPNESVEIPTNKTCKPKLPCMLCKGDHLLKDYIGICQVLEVWYCDSQHPVSSSYSHYTDDTPSTNDSMVKIQKGKVKNPLFLCKDLHLTYLCPHIDEASNLLEDIIFPQEQLPTGYRKLFLDFPLVDKVVDPVPSSIDPILSLESEEQIVHPTLP